MAVIQTIFRTITCNNDACGKTITYNAEAAKEKETFEAPENAWMRSLRTIQALDQRTFTYCSDECEIKGVATGQHNMAQKKLIETAATPGQIAQAAAAARAAEAAGKALQEGRPVTGLTT